MSSECIDSEEAIACGDASIDVPSDSDQSSSAETGTLLADLEARQDEVIAKLDELNQRVLDVLREAGVTDPDASDVSSSVPEVVAETLGSPTGEENEDAGKLDPPDEVPMAA